MSADLVFGLLLTIILFGVVFPTGIAYWRQGREDLADLGLTCQILAIIASSSLQVLWINRQYRNVICDNLFPLFTWNRFSIMLTTTVLDIMLFTLLLLSYPR